MIEYFISKGINIICTARDFVETTRLLELKGIKYNLIGKHGGINSINKSINMLSRIVKLTKNVTEFDFSLSSNYEAPLTSWIKRRLSIVFDDNDISPNWLYAKFADYVISPDVIDKAAMNQMGIKKGQLITYNGFKEDIYIASYTPDNNFLKNLHFNDYVVVRPENIKASYVPSRIQSIVPELLKKLTSLGYNILYLPRYKEDYSYAEGLTNLFIPDAPLNGLDLCYNATAVLTGAGTFSREAALMGIPAVSFFAGNKLLSVDKHLFENGKIFFSRNVDEIIEYIKYAEPVSVDLNRSKKVQKEVFGILEGIIFK